MRTTRIIAALAAALFLAAACSSGGTGPAGTTAGTHAASPAATASVASTPASISASSTVPKPSPTPKPTVVRVTAMQNDGGTYGIGLPLVLFFSPLPTDSTAFTKAVQVTVNGQPADGAWYWEQPTLDEKNAHIVEAHYRLQHYWPADSQIHVSIPIGGLSAGKGLVYSKKLTSLDFGIGDAHVSYVNGRTLDMRVTSNGKIVHRMQVSLGKATTPTFNGVKVVMQKGEDLPGTNTLRPNGTVMMNGPGYTNDPVQWSVRITRSGEYVHSAPWNGEIGAQSTSNGCTNLRPADGEWFYKFAQVGDVVSYTGTDGSTMPAWDGFGDWNMSWGQWQAGGLLLNH
jgi:lipoprotein-anchoring transpeptidase ErfK/SrfK